MAQVKTQLLQRRAALVGAGALLFTAVLPYRPSAQEEKRPAPIRILVGPTGSAEHTFGAALAKLLAGRLKDTTISVKVAETSFERLRLVDAGEAEIAFAAGHVLAAAHVAELSFKTKLENLRTVAALHSELIYLVAAKSVGIATLADLKGKRVSLGPPRSDLELAARAILAAAGLRPEEFRSAEYLEFTDAAELLQKGELDALFHMGLRTDDALRKLAQSMELVFVPLPPEIVAKLKLDIRGAALPANSFPGQSAEIATALVPVYLVARTGLSEPIVHDITQALFEHLGDMSAAHPAGRSIRLESAPRLPPVPLHAGAVKYFKQKGVRF